MPKTAIDYSNTIIYKLINYDCPENVYVGSTTNWTKRKQLHKVCATNSDGKDYNRKVYKIIRDNGCWESWKMIEIKKFSCANRREAEAEEDKIMQELKANMNSKKAYLTEEDKKQYKKKHNVEYHKANREKRNENTKAYHEANKESIKEQHKIYRDAHKEESKQYNNAYREANKEAIKEKRAIKYTCECGLTCCNNHKARHERSKKHINYINSLALNDE